MRRGAIQFKLVGSLKSQEAETTFFGDFFLFLRAAMNERIGLIGRVGCESSPKNTRRSIIILAVGLGGVTSESSRRSGKKKRTKKNSGLKNRSASRAEDKDLPGLGFS